MTATTTGATTMKDAWLTKQEAAELVCKSIRTIERYIEKFALYEDKVKVEKGVKLVNAGMLLSYYQNMRQPNDVANDDDAKHKKAQYDRHDTTDYAMTVANNIHKQVIKTRRNTVIFSTTISTIIIVAILVFGYFYILDKNEQQKENFKQLEIKQSEKEQILISSHKRDLNSQSLLFETKVKYLAEKYNNEKQRAGEYKIEVESLKKRLLELNSKLSVQTEQLKNSAEKPINNTSTGLLKQLSP
jgi:hypothetical protein